MVFFLRSTSFDSILFNSRLVIILVLMFFLMLFSSTLFDELAIRVLMFIAWI